MQEEVPWTFVVKKRLSWLSEMLQVAGTTRQAFNDSLGVDFEFRNARLLLFEEYLDENELAAFDEMVADEWRKDRNYLHRIAQRSYQRCHEFAELGKTLVAENWSTRSNTELAQSLEHFHQQAVLMIPVVYFEPNISERIRTLLLERLQAKQEESQLDHSFLLLTSTTKELTIIKEQRDLLSIGALIQKQPALAARIMQKIPKDALAELPSNLVARLKQHVAAYAWINTDDLFGSPWTEGDLLARLHSLLRKDCRERLQRAQEKQVQREQQRHRLVNDLPVDGELLQLVEIAREHSHLRTHRTETYVRTLYEASGLIREAAKRVGYTAHDAGYLSLGELLEGLRSGRVITRDELNQRKNGMAYVMRDRHLQTFFGEEAQKLADDAGVTEETAPKKTELEGTIANMGIVRGVVKIVQNISELQKVEEGDILVASMTIPEFVPAMEKASAFVTDEGGITCHAAIVSREMDVPCIIGVEIATKVLRDGNIVEVDANNGVVRILG